MKCYNCGHDLPEPREGLVIKFCPHCGAKAIDFAAEAAAAEKAAEAVEEKLEELVEETAAPAVEAAEEVVEAAEETVAEVAEAAEETVTEVAEAAEETVAEAVEEVAAAVEAAPEVVEAAADAVEAAPEVVEEAAAPAAEATAAAASTAAAVGVPPETQAPAKKKSKAPLIVALIIVVLAVAGYFVYQNLPSTKIGKFKKQAAELHASGAYEQEIEVLKQAEALAPDDMSLVQTEAEAMLAKAKALLDENKLDDTFTWYKDIVARVEALPEADRSKFYESISSSIKGIADAELAAKKYEAAEVLLKQRAEIIPAVTGIAAQTEEDLLAVYTKWTEDVLAGGTKEDFVTQEGVIDRILGENILKSKTAELNALKDKLFQAEMAADLKVIGSTMLAQINSDMLSLASLEVGTSFASAYGKYHYIPIWEKEDPASRVPVIGDIDGTNKIGVYYDKDANAVRIYIGQYDGTKRSGKGSWVVFQGSTLTDYRCYVATGTWADDKPNGEFSIYDSTHYISDNSKSKTEKITVNIKNGLYDGEAVNEFTSNSETTVYRPSYKDGHPIIIEDREQGGTVYHIIAYSEDKTTFLHNVNGADALYYIIGFN